MSRDIRDTKDFTFIYDGQPGTLTIFFVDAANNFTIELQPSAVCGMLELLADHVEDIDRHTEQLRSIAVA